MGKGLKIVIGIYKIVSPTGKVYIGQSTNCLNRWGKYKNGAPNQIKLHNSIKKHGRDAHQFDIIHICEEVELNNLEIYYGELFNVYDKDTGLNIRQCGGSKGRLAEESKLKFKETMKRKIENGYASPLIGTTYSEERKLQMSISRKKMYEQGYVSPRKGCKLSEAQIDHLRNINKGKKYSLGKKRTNEQKENYTKILKARWEKKKATGDTKQSEQHKEKRLSRIRGSKRTEEQKMKMRKPRSEEGRKNIREAMEKSTSSMATRAWILILNIETGIFYDSVCEAARAYDMPPTTFDRKLKKRQLPFIIA